MLSGLERFLGQHEHTVAALEAISTFAVVVVSLGLAFYAQRANRTKIRAHVATSTITHSSLEGQPRPRYVTINITNTGNLPVSIPMSLFFWRRPFERGGYWLIPWDHKQHDEWVPQKTYPVEIKPRHSETFFLSDIATFQTEMVEILASTGLFDRWRKRLMRGCVVTEDGRRFTARLGDGVRKEMRAIQEKNNEHAA